MPSPSSRHDNFEDIYYRLLLTLQDAPITDVRGLKTKEVCGHLFVGDPTYPFSNRTGFSERFALTETLQVITGRGDIRQLTELAPKFPSMAPSYVTYGPRVAWQLQRVYELLSHDPYSRQAVVVIYQGEDLHKGYPDCPCTLTLQFIARPKEDGKMYLNLLANMRSNDIWFGTPIDVFMFTFLQRQMAASLGMERGWYQHHTGSLHVYEQHWDAMDKMIYDSAGTEPPAPRTIGEYPPYAWKVVREKAGKWLDGEIAATMWAQDLQL